MENIKCTHALLFAWIYFSGEAKIVGKKYETHKYVILSSFSNAGGIVPFNLFPCTLLPSIQWVNDHHQVAEDF